MRSRLPIILFLVTSAYLSSTADDSKDEFVVLTLDQSNFTQTVSKHDFLVVDFYAPWSVLLTFTFFFFNSVFLIILLIIMHLFMNIYLGFKFNKLFDIPIGCQHCWGGVSPKIQGIQIYFIFLDRVSFV
ncbi:putative protein disulfide-isomerase [Helianthus annuus]|nr:putative protein disulfide-isomerase [Helianthus annuus]